MLPDKYLPDYHFREIHRVKIKAPAERIRATVTTLDFRRSPLIRFLFAIRGMPARMMNLEGLQKGRFTQLELNDSEMIIGLIGQFWKPSGNLQAFETQDFKDFARAGFLKAIWSFALVPQDDLVLLVTETRIQCLGDAARRKFRLYWAFIRPFSGLIRMEILRIIRKAAESQTN
jgi:hypothetical protein